MRLELTPETLLQAYRMGVFPMAESRDDPRLHWFDPVARGVLPLDGFRMSRSLRRRIRAEPFRLSLDQAFEAVLTGCAERESTWINSEIARLFTILHRQGHAHSIEVWEGEELVGGVYGLGLGGAFCGESMFSRRRDASKVALAYLVTHLRNCGYTLFDTQYPTEHLASLGGVEISRVAYRARLAHALQADAAFDRAPLPSAYDVVQFMTQTS